MKKKARIDMKPAPDNVSYTLLDPEALVAATVTKGDYTAPVWIQKRWTEGEFAEYIVKNGCGHCCAAMALCLCGHTVTPYDEYLHCREVWGLPDEVETFHYLSVAGVCASLKSYGVKAEAFTNAPGEEGIRAAVEHIRTSLVEGKLVVFGSVPLRADNPFSTGRHYVLFVGLDGDGSVLVANSSVKAQPKTVGVQTVPFTAVADAMLPTGGILGEGLTWGTPALPTSGYVVVG